MVSIGIVKAHMTNLPGTIVLARALGKHRIFVEIDQTHKILPADTSGNEQGGHPAARMFALKRRVAFEATKEGRAMRSPHLRIYHGPHEAGSSVGIAETTHTPQTVTVPLAEIMPLLRDAVRSERTWLRDFEDDEITISMDLYEVILAYQHYRRPSA